MRRGHVPCVADFCGIKVGPASYDARQAIRKLKLSASGVSATLSSCLRAVKLTPAVRIDRVGNDFARGWRHKLNAGRVVGLLGYSDIWLFRELVWFEPGQYEQLASLASASRRWMKNQFCIFLRGLE